MCTVYIYYLYINTHIEYIFLNYLHVYTFIYLYSYILYYAQIYLIYEHSIFFLYIYIYIYTCMCLYLYIHNKYTHILCKQKLLFWMRFIVWQHYYKLIIILCLNVSTINYEFCLWWYFILIELWLEFSFSFTLLLLSSMCIYEYHL